MSSVYLRTTELRDAKAPELGQTDPVFTEHFTWDDKRFIKARTAEYTDRKGSCVVVSQERYRQAVWPKRVVAA